jgi:hypothetical protein
MASSARVSAWGKIGAEKEEIRARVHPGAFIRRGSTTRHASERRGEEEHAVMLSSMRTKGVRMNFLTDIFGEGVRGLGYDCWAGPGRLLGSPVGLLR